MAKKRKQQAKLKARIEQWETLKDKVDQKNSEHPVSGFYMRKPGSNKK